MLWTKLVAHENSAEFRIQDLGLHRACSTFSALTREKRRRLFWCLYSLENTMAQVNGRPVSLLEEEIDQEHPEDVQLSSLVGGSSSVEPITIPDKSYVRA